MHARAPGSLLFSRLNTRPTCTPVNASSTPLRTCPHDSGATVGGRPFSARLFHSLHLTGLSRRVSHSRWHRGASLDEAIDHLGEDDGVRPPSAYWPFVDARRSVVP